MGIKEFPFSVDSGLVVCEPVFSHNFSVNFFVFDSIKNIEIARRSEYVDMIVGQVSISVPIYFILVKFDKDLIYDCWLNYFAPEGKGKYIFNALSKQDFIYFHFYSREGYVCTIREINAGRDLFENIRQELIGSTPFAMKKVAFTKAVVMREFKDKNDFWEKIIQGRRL
jgi:hypothetical protein